MADTSGLFLISVQDALVIVEAKLERKGVQINSIRDALDDLRSLLRPLSTQHFVKRLGYKHLVGDFYPMLQRQAKGLMKQFFVVDVSQMFCQTSKAGDGGR